MWFQFFILADFLLLVKPVWLFHSIDTIVAHEIYSLAYIIAVRKATMIGLDKAFLYFDEGNHVVASSLMSFVNLYSSFD